MHGHGAAPLPPVKAVYDLNWPELLQGITAQVRAARGGAAAGRHPYHLGPLSNVAAVMGPVGPAWCLPLVRVRIYAGGPEQMLA